MQHDVEWRQVGDWPYEVSAAGRVRRTTKRSNTYPGKLLSIQYNTKGYPMVVLHDTPRRRTVTTHIIVAETFLGPKPGEDWHVNHKNGDKEDNRTNNLEWVPPEENTAHGVRHGLYARGCALPKAKLTPSDVIEMRRLRREEGLTYDEIAERFPVVNTVARRAVIGETWSWVEESAA